MKTKLELIRSFTIPAIIAAYEIGTLSHNVALEALLELGIPMKEVRERLEGKDATIKPNQKGS